MTIAAYMLSGLSLLVSLLLLSHPKFPCGIYLMLPRLLAMALSPCWAVIGAAGAVLGWVSGAGWAVPMGGFSALIMIVYVWRSTRDHDGFERVFGVDWASKIEPGRAQRMMQRRWSLFSNLKQAPGTTLERDVPFWTIPDTDRQLLCDLWRPAEGTSSGLAYVFLHGSGWAVGDKDMYTRPFFSHLTAQGHVVMDVAYRLLPEVDLRGMVGDAKRAVAWIKANADRYGVDPEKIVLGGGSAGAHIATLAGYAPEHPELTPDELKATDLSVRGILSYYPPTDLEAGTRRYNFKRQPAVPLGTAVDPKQPMFFAGRLDILLGGYPEEVPEMYRLANPTTHVSAACPPTLIFQGDHDFLNPIEGTLELRAKLLEVGAPAIVVVYRWTEHVFDFALPQLSPIAQSSMYDADRFLALLAS